MLVKGGLKHKILSLFETATYDQVDIEHPVSFIFH